MKGFYPDDREDQWAGRPFIEEALTDVTDAPYAHRGVTEPSKEGASIPHGDEMAVFRVEDRIFVWTWWD